MQLYDIQHIQNPLESAHEKSSYGGQSLIIMFEGPPFPNLHELRFTFTRDAVSSADAFYELMNWKAILHQCRDKILKIRMNPLIIQEFCASLKQKLGMIGNELKFSILYWNYVKNKILKTHLYVHP